MRCLRRNMSKLWLVTPVDKIPIVDSEGFKTGEFNTVYSSPTEIFIAMYPTNGAVARRIFGEDVSLDMMAVSNDVILTKDSLLFLSQPTGNYATTYDYRVDKINTSLNTNNYGFVRRT